MENFESDYKYIMKRIKKDFQFEIEHKNKGLKVEMELNKEQSKRIYNIYKLDFQIFYPQHKI
jgi:hypothetical protein